MTKTKKRRAVEEPKFVFQIRKPVGLRVTLSLSGIRKARLSLARVVDRPFGAAQFRLDAHDLDAIYLCLGPAQTKTFAARLAALALSDPEVTR